MPFRCLTGILLLLAAPATHAATHVQVEAGALIREVNERDAGRTLVNEQGPGAGIAVTALHSVHHWRVGAEVQWLQSRLDYDGQTQLGAPLSTHTDWSEASAGLTLGRHVAGRTGPYVGGRIEYQWRKRDIQAAAGAAGLVERYDAVWAGLEASTAPFRSTTLALRLGCAVHSTVGVTFDVDVDRASLKLKDHCRAELGAKVNVGTVRGQRLYVRPFVAWERYPTSNSAPLTSAGEPIGRVYLPATEFVSFGIRIGVGRRWR